MSSGERYYGTLMKRREGPRNLRKGKLRAAILRGEKEVPLKDGPPKHYNYRRRRKGHFVRSGSAQGDEEKKSRGEGARPFKMWIFRGGLDRD